MTSRPADPLPAWCTRLTTDLDAAERRATALARTLGRQQINWQPRPDSWSIGQCLDHLRAANEVYVPAIRSRLRGRRPNGPVPEITLGWFSAWFMRNYIEPSPVTRKGKAPSKIVPASEFDPSILDRFLASNQQTRDCIGEARNYDVNRVRFKNPFIPILYFTVGTGLHLLARHEHRHLLQAERIRASAGFPG